MTLAPLYFLTPNWHKRWQYWPLAMKLVLWAKEAALSTKAVGHDMDSFIHFRYRNTFFHWPRVPIWQPWQRNHILALQINYIGILVLSVNFCLFRQRCFPHLHAVVLLKSLAECCLCIYSTHGVNTTLVGSIKTTSRSPMPFPGYFEQDAEISQILEKAA